MPCVGILMSSAQPVCGSGPACMFSGLPMEAIGLGFAAIIKFLLQPAAFVSTRLILVGSVGNLELGLRGAHLHSHPIRATLQRAYSAR